MTEHIQPDQIPGKDIHPDLIEDAATKLKGIATEVRDNGGDIVSEWGNLSVPYQTPDSSTVLDLMTPVGQGSTTTGDNLDSLAGALNQFAADVRPIIERLNAIRADAQTFIDTDVANGVSVEQFNPAYSSYVSGYGAPYGQPYGQPYGASRQGQSTCTTAPPRTITVIKPWHEVQESVDRNNDLIRRVNTEQVELWDAERACANKIREIYGADPIGKWGEDPNDPEAGWGLSEIPDGTEGMPWGDEVERTKNCGEKTATVVFKDFLWDGVIVDGIWGTVEGLGMLTLGYNPEDHSFFQGDIYAGSWSNLGYLASGLVIYSSGAGWADLAYKGITGESFLPGPIANFKDKADEALVNTGKGLIAWDMWSDNPGRAAGSTTFNLATIVMPAGAALTSAKGGTAAARFFSTGARIVDFIDPSAWALKGVGKVAGMGFDGLKGLTKSLNESISSMPEINLNSVDMPSVSDLDSAVKQVDADVAKTPTAEARVATEATPGNTTIENVATRESVATNLKVADDVNLNVNKSIDNLDTKVHAGDSNPVGRTTTHETTPHHETTKPVDGEGTQNPKPNNDAGNDPVKPRDNATNDTNTGTGSDQNTPPRDSGGSDNTGSDHSGGSDGNGRNPDGGDNGGGPDGGDNGGGSGGGDNPKPGTVTAGPNGEVIYHLKDGQTHTLHSDPMSVSELPNADEAIRARATELGLTFEEAHDLVYNRSVESLTPGEAYAVVSLRQEISMPTTGDTIQKVMHPEAFEGTVSGQWDAEVRGYVSKASDTNTFVTAKDYYHGLGLDYTGTKFVNPDGSLTDVYAVRFKPEADVRLDIPGDHAVKQVSPDASAKDFTTPEDTGTLSPDNPFNGNGFAGRGEKQFVPEYVAKEPIKIPDGAEIWRITPDGTETLAAVRQGPDWIKFE